MAILGIPLSVIIVWVIIGLLAGTAAGRLLNRGKAGFGVVMNTLIGLIGALIGGFVFDLLNIVTPLSRIQINAQQLLASFVGAIILVLTIRLMRRA